MLLLELFEAGTKHVTFCFGRMNPPTIGHKQVFDTMQSQGGEMKIFVSQSQDKKKNPLDYATKIKFIKEMFPEYAGDVKKSKVYVRKPDGNIVKVNFGDKKMRIKKSNPARRKSFRARHNCANPGPRHKARYWSCRSW